jgi:hypothetical protein
MFIDVLPRSSVGHQHIECGQCWTSNNLSSLEVAFNFCELFFSAVFQQHVEVVRSFYVHEAMSFFFSKRAPCVMTM